MSYNAESFMKHLTVLNQGYSLETNLGYNNINPKMGPAEREEEYRADQIDFYTNERIKYERKMKELD